MAHYSWLVPVYGCVRKVSGKRSLNAIDTKRLLIEISAYCSGYEGGKRGRLWGSSRRNVHRSLEQRQLKLAFYCRFMQMFLRFQLYTIHLTFRAIGIVGWSCRVAASYVVRSFREYIHHAWFRDPNNGVSACLRYRVEERSSVRTREESRLQCKSRKLSIIREWNHNHRIVRRVVDVVVGRRWRGFGGEWGWERRMRRCPNYAWNRIIGKWLPIADPFRPHCRNVKATDDVDEWGDGKKVIERPRVTYQRNTQLVEN